MFWFYYQLLSSGHVDNIHSPGCSRFENLSYYIFPQNKTIILGLVRGNNNSLISLPPQPRSSSSFYEACCSDENLEICVPAHVNPASFLDQGDLYIMASKLAFHSTVPPNGQVYKNAQGDEAVITYNDLTGNMFGSFKTQQGSYALEPCENGYVWKEFNVSSFEQQTTTDGSSGQRFIFFPDTTDNSTEYTYNVMFYVSSFS